MRLCRTAALAACVGALGCQTGASKSVTPPPVPAAAPVFRHEGHLNDSADFAFMAERIREGAEPWKSAYEAIAGTPLKTVAACNMLKHKIGRECTHAWQRDNAAT